jgi:two-component system, NtrC family, response regulator HydG
MKTDGPIVLVVDDEEDICRNLADILGDVGYRVDTTCDGAVAIEMVRRTAYDVALLDLKMPGVSGLDLCQAIRAIRPATVPILVTAFASVAAAAAARQAGVWQIVSKPANLPALLGLIEEAAGWPMVLVVDDDRDLCTNLGDLFRERGFRISVAHDLDEAAARLHEGAFRVVIIDMKLPTGSGEHVSRIVRAEHPAAGIVLITGHRAETDPQIRVALEGGAVEVCYKPLDVAALVRAVKVLAAAKPPARPREAGGAS